jgi:peptide chain release factor 1
MVKVKTADEMIDEIVSMTNLLNLRYVKSQKQSEWCEKVLFISDLWHQLKIELIDFEEVEIQHPEDLKWTSAVSEEVARLESTISDLKHQLNTLFDKIYPYKHRGVLLEIRALDGIDTDIWVEDLVQMYTQYAENNKWKVEVISSSTRDICGFNEIILEIRGAFVGYFLQFETGIHQIKRRSKIEWNSTEFCISTARVTVMPIVENNEIEIDLNSVEMDISRRKCPRMISVDRFINRAYLLHRSPEISIFCDLYTSQRKNKEKAFQILLSKLYCLSIQKQLSEDVRASIVRNYDNKNNYAIDLRSGIKSPLDRVLRGDLDLLILHRIE